MVTFAEAFKKHKTGLKSAADLSVPFDKSASTKDALVHQKFSLSSKPLASDRRMSVNTALSSCVVMNEVC